MGDNLDEKNDDIIKFTINFGKIKYIVYTILILLMLCIFVLYIQVSAESLTTENISAVQINDYVHMRDVIIVPRFNDIINHKKMFAGRVIYSEGIITNINEKQGELDVIELKAENDENKKYTLYYENLTGERLSVNNKVAFLGKLSNINSNTKEVSVDAFRIDNGNGLFTAGDLKEISSLYSDKTELNYLNDTKTIESNLYGSGYRNYSVVLNSKFVNKLRLLDIDTTSDVIDGSSVINKTYYKIDYDSVNDNYIKLKQNYIDSTLTLEIYDKEYNILFNKTWKNIKATDRASYSYASIKDYFYINIDDSIYIINEKDFSESKIKVSGKGLIEADLNGNVYYLTTEGNGTIEKYDREGNRSFSTKLFKDNSYEIGKIHNIIMDSGDLLIEYEAIRVNEDSKDLPFNVESIIDLRSGHINQTTLK